MANEDPLIVTIDRSRWCGADWLLVHSGGLRPRFGFDLLILV